MANRPENPLEGANNWGPVKAAEEPAPAAPSGAMRPSATPHVVSAGKATPTSRPPVVAQAIIREGKGEAVGASQSPGSTSHANPMNLSAGERVANAAAAAKARINEQREHAARALEGAAATLRQSTGRLPGGERLSGTANRAASRLESAAGYVRDHDVQEAIGDLARVVRRHPGRSLLAAVAAGFLVGQAFRKK